MLEIIILFAWGVFGFWGFTVFFLAFRNKAMLASNIGGKIRKATGIFAQIYSFLLLVFFVYVIGFFNIIPIVSYWNPGGALFLIGDILMIFLGIYLGKKTYERNMRFDTHKYNKDITKSIKKYRLYALFIIFILILYMIINR